MKLTRYVYEVNTGSLSRRILLKLLKSIIISSRQGQWYRTGEMTRFYDAEQIKQALLLDIQSLSSDISKFVQTFRTAVANLSTRCAMSETKPSLTCFQ